VPGSLDIISIDLIVDSDRLYVHAYPNNEQEFPTKKYYFINLDNGTQKIDKEAILANYDNGILQIHLPYTPETIKIEEDEQPIDFEKENLIKIEEFDWDTELSENEPSIESTTKAITG
jgi:HSP20 family molecular chaperone IbpA